MNWRRAALLPLIFVLAGCAEGGTRGTGIETQVLGNVASVQTAADDRVAGLAATDLGNIQVAVQGTKIGGTTDAEGNFTLSGNFEGMINLVFTLPAGAGSAQIALNVPAAGTLTMTDVNLDTQSGAATAATLGVFFKGVVTSVDCDHLVLTMVSAWAQMDMDEYTVDLATSSVTDSNGQAVPCHDIQTGETATVDGVVNPDGSFGEATIEIQG